MISFAGLMMKMSPPRDFILMPRYFLDFSYAGRSVRIASLASWSEVTLNVMFLSV